ncbi:MAG: hypothetical protein M3P18_26450, partial [Actinomycetota bacterium]|nr:hypothetical protein [Actinomycetota bacterium]
WWVLVPGAVISWRLAPTPRWSFLVPLQAAIVGFEWAYVGATALGTWPRERLFVAALWIAFPMALAAAAAHNRKTP